MTDRVYSIDDGRSIYHTCGPTPGPAVIDRYFVKHAVLDDAVNFSSLHSRLDRGIQSATEMLPLKGGEGVTHSFNCTPRVYQYASC